MVAMVVWSASRWCVTLVIVSLHHMVVAFGFRLGDVVNLVALIVRGVSVAVSIRISFFSMSRS